jgi:hypothetical protein
VDDLETQGLGIEERAMRIFHQTLEEFVDECESNRKELPKILDNVMRSPEGSRSAVTMLVEAVRSYVLSLYVGTVLLAAMAIEIQLREFVQHWFVNFTREPAMLVLQGLIEDLDFRRLIEFCKSHELLGNSKEDVYGKLHACYDLRNNYSHAKFSRILAEKARQSTVGVDENGKHAGFGPPGEDPFLQAIYLHVKVAHDDALEIIRLAAESFDVITRKLRART